MESSNRNDMPVFMDNDLDPYTLVHDIVSNWWVIILGAIAGALLTYVVVSSRYVPEYTTQATFVVSSRGDANAYSNLSSANTMAKTFEKILKSNIMEKKICEKLKVEELDAASENGYDHISIAVDSETEIMEKIKAYPVKAINDHWFSLPNGTKIELKPLAEWKGDA